MLQDEAGWYSCTSCIVDVEHGDGKWATMLETCQSHGLVVGILQGVSSALALL